MYINMNEQTAIALKSTAYTISIYYRKITITNCIIRTDLSDSYWHDNDTVVPVNA